MGIFSFSGIVEDGIPTQDCQAVTSKSFASSGEMVFGWLVCATIVSILAWIVHLSLCCPFKKRKNNIYLKDVIKNGEYKPV